MNNVDHSMERGVVSQVPRSPVTSYAAQPAASKRGTSPVVWVLGVLVALVIFAFVAVALALVGIGNMFNNLTPVTVGDLRTESHSVPL